VHPSLPVHDVTELIDYAKRNLAYGSAGIGSSHHICGELIKQKAGIDMVHVPYRGGAPLMQDLLAGNVKVAFNTLPTTLPQAQAGAIRVIAVAERRDCPNFLTRPSTRPFPASSTSAGTACLRPPERRRRSSTSSMRRQWRH
jgi:tripartite-type tricarboxylate transporter receptor subunit TctC